MRCSNYHSGSQMCHNHVKIYNIEEFNFAGPHHTRDTIIECFNINFNNFSKETLSCTLKEACCFYISYAPSLIAQYHTRGNYSQLDSLTAVQRTQCESMAVIWLLVISLQITRVSGSSQLSVL